MLLEIMILYLYFIISVQLYSCSLVVIVCMNTTHRVSVLRRFEHMLSHCLLCNLFSFILPVAIESNMKSTKKVSVEINAMNGYEFLTQHKDNVLDCS